MNYFKELYNTIDASNSTDRFWTFVVGLILTGLMIAAACVVVIGFGTLFTMLTIDLLNNIGHQII